MADSAGDYDRPGPRVGGGGGGGPPPPPRSYALSIVDARFEYPDVRVLLSVASSPFPPHLTP